MGKISPAWAETSVRWLSGRSGFAGMSGRRTFSAKLRLALSKMRFRGYSVEADFDRLVEAWDAALHREMVEWVEGRKWASVVAAVPESFKVRGPDGEVLDEFTIEGVERERGDKAAESMDDVLAAVEKLKPPSQLSAAKELEEAISEELRREDKRYGSW